MSKSKANEVCRFGAAVVLVALLGGTMAPAAGQEQPSNPPSPAAEPPPPAAEPPSPAAEPAARPTAEPSPAPQPWRFPVAWTFADVEVARLVDQLRGVGLRLPVDLEGTITAALQVGVPLGRLRDAQAYRFAGRFTSDRLVVETIVVRNFEARLQYADGVLTFQHVQGTLVEPAGEANAGAGREVGTFEGAAVMELVPAGELEAELRVDGLAAEWLARFSEPLEIIEAGTAEADVTARAAVDRLRDLAAWHGRAAVSVIDLTLEGRPAVDQLSGDFALREGVLRASAVEGRIGPMRLSGSGELAVADAPAWELAAELEEATAPLLVRLVTGETPPEETAGDVAASVRGSGVLGTSQWQFGGRFKSPELHIAGLRVGRLQHRVAVDAQRIQVEVISQQVPEVRLQRLETEYAITPEAWRLEDLTLEGWGGRFAGSGLWSRVPEGRHRAEIRWRDLTLRRSAPLGRADPRRWSAEMAGAVRWSVPAQRLRVPAAHAIAGEVRFDRIQLDGAPLGALAARVATEQAALVLHGTGTLLGGGLRFESRLHRAAGEAPDPWVRAVEANLDWEGTELGRACAVLVPAREPGERVAGLAVREIGAQVRYADAALAVEDLRAALVDTGSVPDARARRAVAFFAGRGRVGLQPNGRLETELRVRELDVGWLARRVQPQGIVEAGSAEAALAASVAIDRLQTVAAWQVRAEGSIAPLVLANRPVIDSVEGALSLEQGVLRAGPVEARLGAMRLVGGGHVAVTGPPRWELEAQLGRAAAPRLVRLLTGEPPPEGTAGLVAASIRGAGVLGTPQWRIASRLESPRLRLAGFDIGRLHHRVGMDAERLRVEIVEPAAAAEIRLQRLSAKYAVTPEAWRLDNLVLEGWDGRFTGSGLWSRVSEGRHRAELAWRDLRLERTAPLWGTDPRRLSAETAGTLRWSVPENSLHVPAAHELEADIHLGPIELDGTRVGSLATQFATEEAAVTVRGTGTLLEGRLAIDSRLQRSAAEAPERVITSGSGTLLWQGGEIQRLLSVLSPDQEISPISGEGLVRASWAVASSAALAWRAELRMQELAYRARPVASQVVVQLHGAGERAVVDRLSGSIAGGRLESTGPWSTGGGRQVLEVRLRDLQLARLAGAIRSEGAGATRGTVGGRFMLSGGDALRLSGTLESSDTVWRGARVGVVRSAISGLLDVEAGRWQVEAREIRASVARGRVLGRATLAASVLRPGGLDLASRWEVAGVDFEDLLDTFGAGGSTLGRGRMDGILELAGRGIRGPEDLTGRIDLRLGGTEARAVPGLPQVSQYLGAVSLAQTRFQQGRLRASLSAGRVRILELWFSSPQLRIWADGTVTLRSGRLDIAAVAVTGAFDRASTPLLALARRAAIDTAVPLTAIAEVNRLLSDRTIFFDVFGTLQRPQARVRAGQTLGRGVAEFLLRDLVDRPQAWARQARR